MRRCWLVVVAWVVSTVGVPAGIQPELKQKLATIAKDQKVAVVVKLDVPTLEPGTLAPDDAIRFMRSAGATAAADVLAVLEQAERAGTARHVNLIWLAGVVSAEVAPGLVPRLATARNVLEVEEDVRLPDTMDDGDTSGPNPNAPIEKFLRDMKVPEVWQAGFTGRNVIVAHIDSGVNSGHPDLADHLWVNPGEIPGDGIDNDGDGKIDDVHGWNFKDSNGDTFDFDSIGHGTRTAGLLCGDGTGGQQTGAAPDIQLMILKRGLTQSSLWNASQYAIDHGAKIIAQAFSWKWADSPKPDLGSWRRQTDAELAAGVIHVQSAGNTGDQLPANPIPYNITTPGNCPAPYLHDEQFNPAGRSSVLTVTSLTAQSESMQNAPFGPVDWSDIAATHPEYPYPMPVEYQDYPYHDGDPRSGLMKPDIAAFAEMPQTTNPWFVISNPGTYYANLAGTSAAASYVAGIVALLKEARPLAKPEELTHALYATAVKSWTGWDQRRGEGRVDAYAALQWILQNVPEERCNGIDDDNDGTIDENASCDDGDVCTTDACVAGTCTHVASGLCSVSGTVTYYRTPDANGDGTLNDPAEPSTKPVAGVEVLQTVPPPSSTTTGPDGRWSIGGLVGNVSVAPQPMWNAARTDAITSQDAQLIARAVVELDVLSPLQVVAADVTGNGRYSAYDASLIAQYSVQLIDRFPIAGQRGSDWAFVRCDGPLSTCAPSAPNPGDPKFDFSPIDGERHASWYGVLYGDVSGSWLPAPALRSSREPAPGRKLTPMTTHRATEATLTLGATRRLPDGRLEAVVELRNADGIQALDLSLAHDASTVAIEDVVPVGLASGYARTLNDRAGRCRVALFGTQPMTGSGPVLKVILAARGVSTRAPFRIEASANEGLVPLRIEVR